MSNTFSIITREAGGTETFKLLRILPLEIWTVVIEHVIRPDDLENICNASSFFREFLTTERVVFLFPKVWSVFGRKYHNLCRNKCNDRIARRRNFQATALLKLRLVCKTWSDTIADFYQSETHHYKLPGDPEEKVVGVKDRWWTEDVIFYDVNRHSERFLRFFKDTHGSEYIDRNPFLGRSFTICYILTAMDDVQDIDSHFYQFLLKYGHHIWYCTLSINNVFFSIITCYRKLEHLLSLMPNLKRLRICYRSLIEHSSVLTLDEVGEMAREIISNPLPILHNLKYLSIKDLPVPIFNIVLRQNCHVAMIDVDNEGVHWNFDIISLNLPNINQVMVNLPTEQEFREVERVQVNWKLQKFHFSLDESLDVGWPRIFSLLETNWGNSLEVLVIKLPKWDKYANLNNNTMKMFQSISLNLPHLKRLKVTMVNLAPLDFILPMKESLEILQINIQYEYKHVLEYEGSVSVKNRERIDFIGYTHRMLQSNIWSQFPNLKYLYISELVIFKRCMVTEYQQNRWSYSRQVWMNKKKAYYTNLAFIL